MGASHFTVYLLETSLDWKQIIDEFNEEKDIDKQYALHKNNYKLKFENISKYQLYTRAAKTNPNWGMTLEKLVTDLDKVTNVSHSYVLFLRVGNQNFAATGGNGYQVIENHKNFSFGIDLLSRLIDRNESVIKRLNDRYISGNIMGGSYQYNGNVSINTEKEFNNYFDEIYLTLSSEKIEKKLGIKINTKKSDYRLLAKDSIKLGKTLTINEFDTLLGSLTTLLEQPGYSINPFYKLKEKDPKIEQLDNKLVDDFRDYLKLGITSEFNIIPFYQLFDSHYIAVNNEESIKENYETTQDIIDYFIEQVSLDHENDVLLAIITKTMLTGEIEGIVETQNNLYEHFDVRVKLNDDTYWLMNGKWFYLKREFINEINDSFINKITNDYDLDFSLDSVNFWPVNIKEGEYNYKHNENESTYVLDKILYKNIEICDLMIEKENKVYFVHVKNGLDGDIRVLVEQIIMAMHMITNGKDHDKTIFVDYYRSISDKIKEGSKSGKESQISSSARKFMKRFPEKEDFINIIKRKEIVFVFAYKSLDSHDFNKPITIESTAAKLAMIQLAEMKNKFDFTLKFLNINKIKNKIRQLENTSITSE